MLKFYVRWRANPKLCPESDEEREKLRLQMLKMTKTDLDAGKLKDWGRCVDGSGGYFVCEMSSEADLFAFLQNYKLYLDIDVRQVHNVEQVIESAEQAIEKRNKAT